MVMKKSSKFQAIQSYSFASNCKGWMVIGTFRLTPAEQDPLNENGSDLIWGYDMKLLTLWQRS